MTPSRAEERGVGATVDAPLHPWWGLFNWSAITLWLTCTVVLALRLLRIAMVAPNDGGARFTGFEVRPGRF